MTATLSIGELARRTELPTSTLRYYERLGILPPAPRQGGKRRYDARSVERVEAVKTAVGLGFTLDEVSTLVGLFDHDETERDAEWAHMAQAKIAELDRRIERARAMRAHLQATLDCSGVAGSDCGCPAEPLSALPGR